MQNAESYLGTREISKLERFINIKISHCTFQNSV